MAIPSATAPAPAAPRSARTWSRRILLCLALALALAAALSGVARAGSAPIGGFVPGWYSVYGPFANPGWGVEHKAMTFVPSSTAQVTSVELQIGYDSSYGAPGPYEVRITTTLGDGSPDLDSGVLADVTLSGDALPYAPGFPPGFTTIPFAGGPVLEAGQRYAVVVSPVGGSNGDVLFGDFVSPPPDPFWRSEVGSGVWANPPWAPFGFRIDKWADTDPPVVSVPLDMTVPYSDLPGGELVTFSVTASDDSGAAGPVTCSPESGSLFPVGPSLVTCSSTDGAGNTGSASFTVTVVDSTPPEVSVPGTTHADATSTAGAAVGWSWGASDAQGVATAACAPAAGSVLPIGTTHVTCTAADPSGNEASGSFDVVVSATQVGTQPPATSTTQSASFTWSSSLGAARYTCSLDGAGAAACSSPRTYNGLAAGVHTLCVKSSYDVDPTCTTWTITGPGAPQTTASATPSGRSVTLTFSASQAGSTFTCQLDGGTPKPKCSSGTTWRGLAAGSHTFLVWATNFAGQSDPTPAVVTVSLP